MPAKPSPKDPGAFRLEVNAEIFVRLEDLERDVKLFLVDICETGARFRSGLQLPPQAGLSFKWVGPARQPIVVHGHVVALKMADKRTAEYDIDFTMSSTARDRLVAELLEVQRRKMFKPPEATPRLEDGDAGTREHRKAYRAVVQIPAVVRALRRGRWVPLRGEVRDLSVGGTLLLLPDDFAEGTELELEFSLPFEAEDGVIERKEVVEMTPFGERRIKKSTPVRPFELIQTQGRIVKKMGTARSGAPLFGVTFRDLPGFLREEIARWLHAHQLEQLRAITAVTKRSVARVVPARVASPPRASRTRLYLSTSACRREAYVRTPDDDASSNAATGDVFGLGPPSRDGVVSFAAARRQYVEDVFGLGSPNVSSVAS